MDYFRDKSSDLSLFSGHKPIVCADGAGASDITFGCSGNNLLYGVG
jgi:hypothetical protein